MRNKFKSVFFAVLLSWGLGGLCYADILFINLNDSTDELTAATNSAKKRGEKLWVISPKTKERGFRDKLDKEISELDQAIAPLEKRYKELDHESPSPENVKELDAINEKYDALSSRRSDLKAQNQSMVRDLEDQLTEIQNKGGSLSTLIISGHHAGNGLYWGTDHMQIEETEIQKVLKDHPSITKNLYSVLAWGCHTGELKGIQMWKEEFPQLKLIIGFAGSGPLAKTEADHAILEEVLNRESELMVSQDFKTAQKNISGIKDAIITNLAGMVNQCYVGAPLAEVSINPFSSSFIQDCNNRKEALKNNFLTYLKYFNAEEKGFEDPPADTDKNPLRAFYNDEETSRDCYKLFGAEDVPSADQIVGLIHSRIIQKNFEAYYGVKLGANRKEMMQIGVNLSDREVRRAGQHILGGYECVPASWITQEPVPGVKPQDPDYRCISK